VTTVPAAIAAIDEEGDELGDEGDDEAEEPTETGSELWLWRKTAGVLMAANPILVLGVSEAKAAVESESRPNPAPPPSGVKRNPKLATESGGRAYVEPGKCKEAKGVGRGSYMPSLAFLLLCRWVGERVAAAAAKLVGTRECAAGLG
jgi:hypothetical protein